MTKPERHAPAHAANELDSIYTRRFSAHITYRNRVWQVLTSRYLSRYIGPDATVLDLGCGYGEFINNVACGRKFALDLNPRARQHLAAGITFFEQNCSEAWPLPDGVLDVVFSSNFFEHLPSKQAMSDSLAEARRCLRDGGRMIVMGPNVRFLGGAYWDFWDHHLALTENSVAEALEVQGFEVQRVIDRFLPYTMVNKRYAPAALIALYLKLPLAWRIFGKQFLVIAAKPGRRG